MIDIETPQEIEVVSNGIDVEARSLDVEVVDLKELDVTVAKREFVITGDDIYVPRLYEDAPQWMKDLVQIVVNSAMDTGNASTLAQLASMLSQFATSYVPLNQYTQSILDLSNEDANIHTVIETLNSNYNNGLSQANGQIIDLQNTKASKDEVVAQVVSTLASQLANPTSSLGAVIGNLQQTIVNNQNANALSMQTLTSSLNDVSGNVSANSSAITGLQTNVSNINGTLTSQAGQITNLRSDLTSGTGTWAAGDTSVTNTVKSYTDGKVTGVESKWAYNSSLTINGTSYTSGFGLSNSAGTGAGSEFWINADKLKFTNNAKTGSKAPFSIDASGATPEITFNGKVSFSNVTGYTPPDVSGDISANNDIFAQKLGYANYAAMVNAAASGQTVINGGYINTGLIQAGAIAADRINTTGLIADNINTSVLNGKTLNGSIINGARINGSVIKASYLDLNGSLQVLTNYIISVAAHDSNPLYYSDSVYISSDNNYRIPSLSSIEEETKEVNVSYNGADCNSKIMSYNTANVGYNIKCVRVRPPVTHAGGTLLDVRMVLECPSLLDRAYFTTGTRTDSYQVYIAGGLFGTIYAFVQRSGLGNTILLYKNGVVIPDGSTFDYKGFTITINNTGHVGFTISIGSTSNMYLTEDYDNVGYGLFRVINIGGKNDVRDQYHSSDTLTYTATVYLNNSTKVDNML